MEPTKPGVAVPANLYSCEDERREVRNRKRGSRNRITGTRAAKSDMIKREANRAAAQRCRARKVSAHERLVTKLREALREHAQLQEQAEMLKRMHAREVAMNAALRTFVQAHSQYCLVESPLPPASQQHLALLLLQPTHPELERFPDSGEHMVLVEPVNSEQY